MQNLQKKMDGIEDLLQDDPGMQQMMMMSAIEFAKDEQKVRIKAKAEKEAQAEEELAAKKKADE